MTKMTPKHIEKAIKRFKELSGDVSANSDASLRMVLDEFEKDFLDTWIPAGLDALTLDGNSRSARKRGLDWAKKLYQAGQAQGEQDAFSKCKNHNRTIDEQIYRNGQDSVREEVKKWAEGKFKNFSKIPKKERMIMSEGDIGFMHGQNDFQDDLSSFLSNISTLKDKNKEI